MGVCIRHHLGVHRKSSPRGFPGLAEPGLAPSDRVRLLIVTHFSGYYVDILLDLHVP